MKNLDDIKAELIEAEENMIIENIEAYDWLIEHTIEDQDTVLDNFKRNYKPSDVHSIVQFGGYVSSEAEAIIEALGEEETYNLILKHLDITQDHDLYHEHWNDIGSEDWSEYEVQVDLDSDHEHHQAFIDAGEETTFWGFASLGMVRYKLDAEAFEKALKTDHNIDVNELCLEEPSTPCRKLVAIK